jgi:hypothetical protein
VRHIGSEVAANDAVPNALVLLLKAHLHVGSHELHTGTWQDSTYLFGVGGLEGLGGLVHSEVTHVVVHKAELDRRLSQTHIPLI